MSPEKWCSGLCGRLLPRSEFYLNGNGNQQGRCKACHRVGMRQRYRMRYKWDKAFRDRERARAVAAYRSKRNAA